jgi:hypothetical protein
MKTKKEVNKEEKLKRIEFHRNKRNEKYFARISYARDLGCPLHAIGKYGPTHWKDHNSPTGYSQKCSYQGICEYPCNGDC